MNRWMGAAVLVLLAMLAGSASASGRSASYEVTITNITKGQTFTPILVATHSRGVSMFEVGTKASPELELLAEGGATDPMREFFEAQGRRVGDIQTTGGLLGPGESIRIEVEGNRWHRYLSLGAMLIPTNDTFFALNGVYLPYQSTREYGSPGYDAGTEENDQNCSNIPGPRCGGEGPSPGPNPGDEGYVHIGNGFHELGEEDEAGNEILGPLIYDWRNSVARVVVRRIH